MSQPQACQALRSADGRFDPFKPDGASLVGGRWNSPGLGVIYASRCYAGAMLECLAHAGTGRVPRTHVAVEIAIAATVTVEGYEQSDLCAADDGVVQVDGHGFQSFDTLAIVIGCQYRRTLFIDGATRNIPAEVDLHARHLAGASGQKNRCS